ncbi:hypothetical protein CV770_18115, partial [Bradyrhizobium sp. AC87j1]
PANEPPFFQAPVAKPSQSTFHRSLHRHTPPDGFRLQMTWQPAGGPRCVNMLGLDRGIQYAAASQYTSPVSGILDRPVEPGDDSEGVASSCLHIVIARGESATVQLTSC